MGILLLYSFVLVWAAEEKSLTGSNKDFNIDDRQFQPCPHIPPFYIPHHIPPQPCPCYSAGCGCGYGICNLKTGQCGSIENTGRGCPCKTNKIIVEDNASLKATPELCAASCTGSCKVTTKF